MKIKLKTLLIILVAFFILMGISSPYTSAADRAAAAEQDKEQKLAKAWAAQGLTQEVIQARLANVAAEVTNRKAAAQAWKEEQARVRQRMGDLARTRSTASHP